MIASLSLTRVTLSGSGTAKGSGCSISKLHMVVQSIVVQLGEG